MSKAATLWKVGCTLSAATLLRAARYGPRDAAQQAIRAYDVIDPLCGVGGKLKRLVAAFPKVKLTDIVTTRPTITIESLYTYIEGSLHPADQVALMTLLRDRRPELVLEIGTFNGGTTRLIALNLPGSKIHTLDLPQDLTDEQLRDPGLPKDDFHLISRRRVGEAFLSDPGLTNITQHFGDSATWDFSPVHGLDFVFIDGSHTYPYIKNDTIRSAEAAAERATIVWHDFDRYHYDVVRYLTDLAGSGLPVRHIESTAVAMMDYDRSLHLETIRAAGEGLLRPAGPAGH